MSLYTDLHARGIAAQETHPEELQRLLEGGPVTVYTGFDPTADSLTVGHLVPLLNLARAQRAGHRPIALVGGATALIGDPTGKTELRKMLTLEDIRANGERFKGQMSRFLDFDGGRALLVNNADWFAGLGYLDMLRDVGVHFSVNRMLSAEAFKSRWERGLSFLEFNYMILQAYDFLVLHDRYQCQLQLGGDDQWSNILAGADLIRRVRSTPAFAMTLKLLTTADGKKMGKTEKGALWLDAEKTSPVELFQYFRNVPDDTLPLCLGLLTLLPADEVRRLSALGGGEVNHAKETLAHAVTSLVHGEDVADQARSAARAAFGGGGSREDIPAVTYARSEVPAGGLPILEVLHRAGLVKSNGEGKRLIAGGGVKLGDDKISDPQLTIPAERLEGEGVELRKGKAFFLVRFTS